MGAGGALPPGLGRACSAGLGSGLGVGLVSGLAGLDGTLAPGLVLGSELTTGGGGACGRVSFAPRGSMPQACRPRTSREPSKTSEERECEQLELRLDLGLVFVILVLFIQ
jgi:hypothetical protein